MWKIAGIFDLLMVGAYWYLPEQAWVAVNMSYFMLGSIFCFLLWLQDKQGPSGRTPFDKEGVVVLIPVSKTI